MDTILRLNRASQPTMPVGTFRVRSVVDAFPTVQSVPVSVLKVGVRSNDRNFSSGESKPSSEVIRSEVRLCEKTNCWLNVLKVEHKVGHHGENIVRHKKSEGTPLSRGKPIKRPGEAETSSPPVKGGNPLTGVQNKVDHGRLVKELSQSSGKTRLVGETQKLAEAARLTNLQSSVADSTAKNYAYLWSRFKGFCEQINASVMPFSGETAGLFLSHLAETASGLGGVTNARAALNFYHSVKFPESVSPAAGRGVGAVLKGINRRFQKPTVKKTPLAKNDFFKFMALTTKNGDFEHLKLCELRLAAQIALMYTTFSRYKESAALRVKQVSKIGEDLLVTFQKGKNYQYGEARRAVIAAQPGRLNPVNVILKYMHRLRAIQKTENGLLFPSVTSSSKGGGVLASAASYKAVLSQFKNAVIKTGVSMDAASYGLHSMRRGAVTSAANNGASVHAIQKQMRVASGETVKRYASLDTRSLKAACATVFM